MKIKQTVIALLLVGGISGILGTSAGILGSSPAYALSCGGVTTSILSCSQTAPCPDGTDPYQGGDPKVAGDPTADAAAQKAYKTKYNHDYGKCKDGSIPKSGLEESGVWGLLMVVINILTAGIGVLAVAGIVYGSILYTSAGGSSEKVSKAREVIRNVVIGIIAYALMYAVLNFIIPGGLFT